MTRYVFFFFLVFVELSFMFGRVDLDEAAMYGTLMKKITVWHQDKLWTKRKSSLYFSLNSNFQTNAKISTLNGDTPNSQTRYVLIFSSKAFTTKILLVSRKKFLMGHRAGNVDLIFNQDERGMLIKFIPQAIPIHQMSCFKLPQKVSVDINCSNPDLFWSP